LSHSASPRAIYLMNINAKIFNKIKPNAVLVRLIIH
jgi:hypothetical protein